jgi:autotransporter-associated beta strand protein
VNTNVTALNFPSLPGQNSITNATTHSLRFNDGFSHFMTLSGVNTIETGGILFGNNGNSATQLNGGSLRPSPGVSELLVHAISTGNGWGSIINSDIVDNGAAVNLVVDGPGSLVLDGNKSFTGTTYVGGIANATSQGNAPGQGAGTLVLGKALGGSATGSVIGAIVNDGVVAFNRSGTYTVPNTITGSGTVTQWSEGTLVLNRTVSSGGLDLRNGATNLDFSAAGAPANNIVPAGVQTANSIWTDPGRLTLRNTTLTVTGAAGASNTQTFGITDVQGSTSINLVPGAGGTVSLNLGAYIRPNNSTDGAGVLKASLPAGASLVVPASFPGVANSLVADNGQAFVTVNGTDWGAKNSTNTQIVSGSSIGGFYTNLSALTASSNADYNADTTVAAGVTLGSLRFNTVAAPATLTVNSGQILRLGGVLVTPNAAATTTIAGPGSITAAATGNRDLTIFQNSGQTLTISAVIADNTVSTGVTNVVKEGSGTLVMSGANTYAGKTYVQGGLLDVTAGNIGSATTAASNIFVREGEMRVGGTATVATGGNFVSVGQRLGEVGTLTLRNSAVWTTAADFNVADVAATGTLNVQDSAILNVNNFFVGKAGGSANGTVNISGGAINITTGSSDVRIGGNNVGDALAQGTINQTGGAMNVSRNFQLGAYGVGTYNQSGGSYTANTGFVGIGRYQSGVGTWNLSGTGSVTATAAGAGSAFIVAELGRGTLNISGNSTFNAKSLSIGHNSGVGDVVQTGGTVNLSATGNVVFTATYQNGVILAPQGTGSGSYTLSGGSLSTQAISGGTGTSNFTFDGGTLKPIAGNATFITGLTTANVKGGAVIDTSGFNVSILPNLQHDASGPAIDGGLAKNGLGVLTLAGNNSYTGPTAITNGSVLVNGSITSTSGVTIGNGGLIGGSGIVTTASNGNVTVAAGGRISPGNSPGNLTFTLGTGVLDLSAVGATSIGSLIFELGTSSDKVTLASGSLSLGAGQLGFNDFTFSDSGGLAAGVYTLFDANSAFLGSLDAANLSGTLPGGLTGTLTIDTAGNNLNLNVVPEPGTLGLALLGLGGMGFRRRRLK